MNSRIFYWSLVSALAGFLFGFDTVVISGAEQTIQSLWNLSPGTHGLVMAAALYGTVLGSIVGGWPTDRFGRKKTLLWIGGFYLVSAIWSGLATTPTAFIVARFLGGLGVGISTVAAPLYISEISPPERRGRLAGLFQFNIVFGILVAFLSNWLLRNAGEHAWRWMLGVEAFPAALFSLLCFTLPESPRWLIARKGDRPAGLAVLRLLQPSASDAAINRTADEIAAASVHRPDAKGFWSARLRVPILLAFFVAFFNQLSGINAILYFAPRIFGLTGSENALSNSIGIGVTNLVFTYVGLWLIDRLGRRTLLTIGSFGYIASLGLCALAFFTWAPQFRAASKAVDVRMIAGQLETANPARKEALAGELAVAHRALSDATADPRSGATPVPFSIDVSLNEVRDAAGIALKQASAASGNGGTMVLVCIFAFIAAHAVGQGAVIWVLISEIFPNRFRGAGQAFGSFTHWIFAALLTQFFPLMIAAFAPGIIFLFFCGMMVLQLLWVRTMVPETKGVPLEEMEKKLGIK
jgi:MFS family permease